MQALPKVGCLTEKVAVTGPLDCIGWLTRKSKDRHGSVQTESLPRNDEGNKKWQLLPLTTEYLRAIPRATRPFWHRQLFYQRPGTSKSLAEEPWAREVHMEDLKAWKITEPSGFLFPSSATASWFPTSLPLSSLRTAKAEEVMGSREPYTTSESVGQIWMLAMGPWFLHQQPLIIWETANILHYFSLA